MTKCPVCDSKLLDDTLFYSKEFCKNGCYKRIRDMYSVREYLFNEEFKTTIEDHSDYAKQIERKFSERLAYWKENDRYLMKIMDGDK